MVRTPRKLRKGRVTRRGPRKGSRRGSKKGYSKIRSIRKIPKNIKITIKNLGKKRKYKRIQHGCSNTSNSKNRHNNMKGGGPLFQPLSDGGRLITGGLGNMYTTLAGNDSYSNQIISSPMANETNYK